MEPARVRTGARPPNRAAANRSRASLPAVAILSHVTSLFGATLPVLPEESRRRKRRARPLQEARAIRGTIDCMAVQPARPR
jgi:hypothetical protein